MGKGVPAKGEAFPSTDATVEFGWDDDRKVSGRRKKAQRKAKPGSFGEQGRCGPSHVVA